LLASRKQESPVSKPTIKADAFFDRAVSLLSQVKNEIEQTVIGQSTVVDNTLITLACGGHALLVGVPGLAKTLLVETVGTATGLATARVQCTPDLMPADILGSEVLDQDEKGRRSFRFIKGPVFTQLLMADEINRASPRTQSALLQAMQEHRVTVMGETYALPVPFHVLATQNPIEQEGTYPLPEAQLDRFMMQIDIGYPDEAAERAILLATTTGTQTQAKNILTPDDLMNIQTLVREMPIGQSVVDAILKLVRNARPGTDAPDDINTYVTWAPGPRGAQAFMLATRARALLDGRSAPSVDDVITLAIPILQHRMSVNFKATASGLTTADIIQKLCTDL
jgi:MoxR-like ATPase